MIDLTAEAEEEPEVLDLRESPNAGQSRKSLRALECNGAERAVLSTEEQALRERARSSSKRQRGADTDEAKAAQRRRREDARMRKKAERGHFKLFELTAVLDNTLLASDLGREATLALQRASVLYSVAPNRLESTVEFWRHPKRSEPFDAGRESPTTADALRVPFVVILMDGNRAADLHNSRQSSTDCNISSGLERFVEYVQRKYEHASVSLCIHSFEQALNQRERHDPSFSRAHLEKTLARLSISHQNIRQATLQEQSHAADHIANLAIGVAWQPYWEHETLFDLFNNQQQTSRKAQPDTTTLGRTEALSPKDAWFRALTNLKGVGEPVARAIVHAYPTMFSLMQVFADTGFDVETRKKMVSRLQRIDRDDKSERSRIGPAMAERLYQLFGPKRADDSGSDIVFGPS